MVPTRRGRGALIPVVVSKNRMFVVCMSVVTHTLFSIHRSKLNTEKPCHQEIDRSTPGFNHTIYKILQLCASPNLVITGFSSAMCTWGLLDAYSSPVFATGRTCERILWIFSEIKETVYSLRFKIGSVPMQHLAFRFWDQKYTSYSVSHKLLGLKQHTMLAI